MNIKTQKNFLLVNVNIFTKFNFFDFYISELRLFSSCFWIHFCEIISLLASGRLTKKNDALSILSSSSVLIYFAAVLILLFENRISSVTLSGIFISLSSSRRIPFAEIS